MALSIHMLYYLSHCVAEYNLDSLKPVGMDCTHAHSQDLTISTIQIASL